MVIFQEQIVKEYCEIAVVKKLNQRISDWLIILEKLAQKRKCIKEERDLTHIQIAAAELTMPCSQLIFSINELAIKGYLISAEIILRPLIERICTLDYIYKNDSGLKLWQEGWPYNKRPKFLDLLEQANFLQNGNDILRNFLNEIVHADKEGIYRHTIELEGATVLSPGPDRKNPERCDFICQVTDTCLLMLCNLNFDIYEFA